MSNLQARTDRLVRDYQAYVDEIAETRRRARELALGKAETVARLRDLMAVADVAALLGISQAAVYSMLAELSESLTTPSPHFDTGIGTVRPLIQKEHHPYPRQRPDRLWEPGCDVCKGGGFGVGPPLGSKEEAEKLCEAHRLIYNRGAAAWGSSMPDV